MDFILLVVLCVGLIWGAAHYGRRVELMKKYNDAEIVTMIMGKRFWQGQTQEQLLDSLGRPQDIDETVMKTKLKQVWKYQSQGSNRYGLRITLEDRTVVGWKQQ